MINPLLPTLYMYIGYEILSSSRISGNMFPQFYYCYVLISIVIILTGRDRSRCSRVKVRFLVRISGTLIEFQCFSNEHS